MLLYLYVCLAIVRIVESVSPLHINLEAIAPKDTSPYHFSTKQLSPLLKLQWLIPLSQSHQRNITVLETR